MQLPTNQLKLEYQSFTMTFFYDFGSSEMIFYDQGREFKNELFHNLNKILEYLDCLTPHITQRPMEWSG